MKIMTIVAIAASVTLLSISGCGYISGYEEVKKLKADVVKREQEVRELRRKLEEATQRNDDLRSQLERHKKAFRRILKED